MSSPSHDTVRNGILRSLSPESFERLRPHLHHVLLPLKTEVAMPDEPTEFVFFVETGVASMVAYSETDEHIEVGRIGWEGLINFHIAHGVDRTPHRTFIQADAEAYSMSAKAFREALDDQELRLLVGRYIHVYEIQLAQTALANGRYKMDQRLARWLLMCHDRLRTDRMPVTHEFLSLMLGVRRSGVTTEIRVLEGERIIKATRGLVHVRDRERLEEAAGGSYGVPEREYGRLFETPMAFRATNSELPEVDRSSMS